MLKKINERIEEKVTQGEGTWIDWQYLKDAATHLTKVYILCIIQLRIFTICILFYSVDTP